MLNTKSKFGTLLFKTLKINFHMYNLGMNGVLRVSNAFHVEHCKVNYRLGGIE